MSIPREPRQRMINMMYLVLTALLALNVSSEILNAFKTVNNSLQNTNTTVRNSTETILASLDEKSKEGSTQVKAQEWLPKAKQVESFSNALYAQIQGYKDQILKDAGYDPKEPSKKYKEDNLDIATHLMVEKGEGKKLYDALVKYKQDVLGVDPLIKTEFEKTLQIDLTKPQTEAKGNNSWEAAYFRMVPTVAALTILSKFQNDVRTSENKVVAFCHEQVGKVSVRFDKFAAIIGQSSNYIMPGQEIEVTAGVGAFSTKASPQISIGGKTVQVDENGVAKIKVPTAGVGQHSIPVHISYTDQDGKQQVIDKTIPYTVGQSSASIALDEMNVLYIGYENKISIAASGGGDDKVSVSISGGGGSITKTGGGHYIAKVNSVTDDCMINVSVDGKPAASSKFRVRTIPQPVGTVGGFASGDNIAAGAFKAQTGVGAFIKDFPLNLKYSVTSFILTADDGDGNIEEAPCKGNMFDARAQGIVRKLQPGRMVTVDDIRAVGPDGRTQKLPSLVYYIK
jgi:gliding motility-associated protein GldM